MRSLGVRLALAFAAVIIVSVGGVALLAVRETANEFQAYVERGRTQSVERVATGLTRYYQARDGWAGVDWLLAGWLRPPLDRLVVADAAGVVVADTEGSAVGQPATAARLDAGLPLRVRGQQVGTLYATLGSGPAAFIPRLGGAEGRLGARAPSGEPRAGGAAPADVGDAEETEAAGRAAERLARRPLGLPPFGFGGRPGLAPPPSVEASFLERVNRAFLVAALAAAALAGLLSLLLARQIARPLRELADGARRIAAGDLARRVPVRGPEEVSGLAVAFNEMAASLERAEAARRNLVADVAHELRTPLTVVEGTVDAILDGVYPADRERLESIREEVALLDKLVADLRELSLAEAGGLRLEREPTEPAALVRRVVAAAGARAEARGVRLVADAGAALPPVDVDSARIAQVLTNLLDNALRYTPAGGWVQVGARAAAPDDPAPRVAIPAAALASVATPSDRIEAHAPGTPVAAVSVSTSASGNGTAGAVGQLPVPTQHSALSTQHPSGVCFWVADSGPGIAADALPHVFERFYRADPSRARRSGGSGLGLAIARRYVEAHGGRIWAESPAGHGATVAFWLPASASGPAPPQ